MTAWIPGPSRHTVRLAILLAPLAVALAVPPSRAAEINRYIVDTGPLRIRDQFLLGMGFLAFDPVSADIQPKGGWQLDLINTITNTFAHSSVIEGELEARDQRDSLTLSQLRAIDAADSGDGIFQLDGELYRTAIAVRRGLGKGSQIELVLPILNFQGGIVDSTIEGFHDTFGFGQAGRTGVAKDDFLAYARSSRAELFLDRAPGIRLGDVVIGSKLDLLRRSPERRFKLALETLVKLPTGDESELASSGSTDLGAQVLMTRYFDKACLHTSFGLLYLGEWEELGTPSQLLPSLMAAYERALGPKSSGLAQLTVSESPFRDLELDELAETSIQVTLGFKRVLWERQVLFVGFTENIQNLNNTADVGFHVGLTQTFDPR